MGLILTVCEIQDDAIDRKKKTLKTHDKKGSLSKIKINW